MKSTILTKINKTQLQFKDLIGIVKTQGDTKFLLKFTELCHPRAINTTLSLESGKIRVETAKTYYDYTIYATHIKRVDGLKNSTVWYQIN